MTEPIRISLEWAFWLAAGGAFYAYFGYPLLLLLVGHVRRRPEPEPVALPRVSIIIATHNEAHQLADKLSDTLALTYPPDRVEIIVAADGSTDATAEVVGGFARQGVRLVETGRRLGKEGAQKLALQQASGEIIVFTDAGTRCAPATLEAMARRFADPGVGCVSGVDRHLEAGAAHGESWYLRYEMFLRRLETRAGSLVGLSGSLFAVRREICDRWSEDKPSDFHVVLDAIRMGYRGVSEPAAIGYYRPLAEESREFRRKVRTVLRGMTAFFQSLDLLNPIRHGLAAWQLVSHKLFRWLVPFFQVVSLGTAAALAPQSAFFAAVLGLQLAFYAAALLGWKPGVQWRACRVPYWFCLFNASILAAWIQFLLGRRIVLWEPTRRE